MNELEHNRSGELANMTPESMTDYLATIALEQYSDQDRHKYLRKLGAQTFILVKPVFPAGEQLAIPEPPEAA